MVDTSSKAMALVSVAQWAESLGISRQAGHQAVKRCKIPLEGGRVDPAVANVLYQQRTRARAKAAKGAPGAESAVDGVAVATDAPKAPAAAPAPPPPPSDDSYQSARARRERAEAEEAELRVARAAGRQIDRERAEAGAFEAFRELRDAVFAAGKSAARRTVGMNEVREVELVIEDEIRAAFEGWDARMAARLAEAGRS
jgi:hypothetical protein